MLFGAFGMMPKESPASQGIGPDSEGQTKCWFSLCHVAFSMVCWSLVWGMCLFWSGVLFSETMAFRESCFPCL